MFDADFYLKLVVSEFGKELSSTPVASALKAQHPRILVRLNDFFADHPLKKNGTFNHFRPSRYFSEHITALKKQIDPSTLDRFESAFRRLNALLPQADKPACDRSGRRARVAEAT